jgi:hypothetical protein
LVSSRARGSTAHTGSPPPPSMRVPFAWMGYSHMLLGSDAGGLFVSTGGARLTTPSEMRGAAQHRWSFTGGARVRDRAGVWRAFSCVQRTQGCYTDCILLACYSPDGGSHPQRSSRQSSQPSFTAPDKHAGVHRHHRRATARAPCRPHRPVCGACGRVREGSQHGPLPRLLRCASALPPFSPPPCLR